MFDLIVCACDAVCMAASIASCQLKQRGTGHPVTYPIVSRVTYLAEQELVSSAASLSRFTLSLPQRVSIDSLHGLVHRDSPLRVFRVITFAECLQHDLVDAARGVCAGESAEAGVEPVGERGGGEGGGGGGDGGDGGGGVAGLARLKRAFRQQLPHCHCWFDVH